MCHWELSIAYTADVNLIENILHFVYAVWQDVHFLPFLSIKYLVLEIRDTN